MYSFSDVTTLQMIYYGYIHFIMEYGIIFWGNSSGSRKVPIPITKENY
jgi:hypothetical protein